MNLFKRIQVANNLTKLAFLGKYTVYFKEIFKTEDFLGNEGFTLDKFMWEHLESDEYVTLKEIVCEEEMDKKDIEAEVRMLLKAWVEMRVEIGVELDWNNFIKLEFMEGKR